MKRIRGKQVSLRTVLTEYELDWLEREVNRRFMALDGMFGFSRSESKAVLRKLIEDGLDILRKERERWQREQRQK